MRWHSDPLQSMQPRRQALWQDLVEAAVEEIGRRGYPETTIQDITARAGISRTQFYFLFEDKEQCFLAAQSAVLTELETRLRAPDYIGLDWPEAIRRGIDALTEAFDESPAFARLILVESQIAGPEALDRQRAAFAQLAPYIDRGRELFPSSRSMPASIAEMAIGSVVAILSREVLDNPEPDFGRLGPQLHFAVLLPYLGPAEAEALSRAGSF